MARHEWSYGGGKRAGFPGGADWASGIVDGPRRTKGSRRAGVSFGFFAVSSALAAALPRRAFRAYCRPSSIANCQYSTKSVDILTACNPALPRILRHFSANRHKCLSINNLQLISGLSGQGQSNPVKVNQGKKSRVWVSRDGRENRNPYQNSRDYECRQQQSGFLRKKPSLDHYRCGKAVVSAKLS